MGSSLGVSVRAGSSGAFASRLHSRGMATVDESVLEFIGIEGRTPAAVADRFPNFDVIRLVRAQLVDIVFAEFDTVGHIDEPVLGEMRYVLTERGQTAIGLNGRDETEPE